MEVWRDEQYAPVKNAPGSSTDSPDTARAALIQLHKKYIHIALEQLTFCIRWIRQAGGAIGDSVNVEVSPLVSYEGENLEQHCRHVEFDSTEFVHIGITEEQL